MKVPGGVEISRLDRYLKGEVFMSRYHGIIRHWPGVPTGIACKHCGKFVLSVTDMECDHIAPFVEDIRQTPR